MFANSQYKKNLFEWDDNIKIFIEEVDKEHKQLVDIINNIHLYTIEKEEEQLEAKKDEEKQLKTYGMVVKPSNLGKIELAELQNFIDKLKSYTIYHFQNEEEYMQRQNLCKAYIHKHHILHLNFRQQVEVMTVDMGNSEITVKSIQKLLNFLINWLVLHIVGEDKDMAKQVKLIHEDGLTPEEAYERVESEKNSQATVMIKALQELLIIFQERSAELARIQAETQKQVEKKTNEYLKMYQEYENLSKTDQLTGIFNRRKAMEVLEENWSRYEMPGNNFSILYFDLDQFKEVNDIYGHDKGDLVLKTFTDKILLLKIPNSVFCRLGGDEFLMILENTNNEEAVEIANNILGQINQIILISDDNQEIWRGSASIGVGSTTNLNAKSYEELLKEADEYLYEAKNSGKNCIKSSINSVGDCV